MDGRPRRNPPRWKSRQVRRRGQSPQEQHPIKQRAGDALTQAVVPAVTALLLGSTGFAARAWQTNTPLAETIAISALLIFGGVVWWRLRDRLVVTVLVTTAVLLGAAIFSFVLYQHYTPANKTIVIVARFADPDPAHNGVTDIVLGNMREALARYPDVQVTPYHHVITEDNSDDALTQIRRNTKVTIVIWGEYFPGQPKTGLIINFDILHPIQDFPGLDAGFNGRLTPETSSPYDKFSIQTNLADQLGYISLFAAGMVRYEKHDWLQAVTDLRGAIDQTEDQETPLDRYALDYFLGNAYRHAKLSDFTQALDSYNAAIKERDTDPEPYIARGMLHKVWGERTNSTAQMNLAIEDFEFAIKLDPHNAPAFHRLSMTYREERQFNLAVRYATETIKYRPGFAGAYLNRGISYAEIGQYQNAINDFNRTAELDPAYYPAYDNRGICYRELSRFPQAIADFRQAIRIASDGYYAYQSEGVLYVESRNYRDAVVALTQAIKSSSTSTAESYYYRGLAYTALQQPSAALGDFTQSLRQSPTASIVLLARGRLELTSGDHRAARVDFTAAAALPTRPKSLPKGWYIWSRIDQEYAGDTIILAMSRPSSIKKAAQDALAKLGP